MGRRAIHSPPTITTITTIIPMITITTVITTTTIVGFVVVSAAAAVAVGLVAVCVVVFVRTTWTLHSRSKEQQSSSLQCLSNPSLVDPGSPPCAAAGLVAQP